MTRCSLLLLAIAISFFAPAQHDFYRLMDQGQEQLQAGDISAARLSLEKALPLLSKKIATEDKAVFFNNLGLTYYASGEYKKGIDEYRISLEYCRQTGIDSLIAQSQLNLGLAYKEIGDLERAVQELLAAARISEREGNRKELASTWNAIGNIERGIGNFEKALSYHRKALALRRAIGYQKGIADSYHNIGHVYVDLKHYDRAEQYLSDALELKRMLGNKPGEMNTITLLGQVYLEKKQPRKAFSLLNRAYALRLESGSAPQIAFSLYHLGKYYAQINNPVKAHAAYLQSAELSEAAGDYAQLVESLIGEIDLLQREGNDALLVKQYDALLKAQKQLDNDANRKELARLEIAYDVERKDHELGNRRKQARLDRIRIENEQLYNRLLTAGILASIVFAGTLIVGVYRLRRRKRQVEYLHHELSHRTKNYFGLLSGILKSDRKNAHDGQVIYVLDENIRRVEAMGLVQRYLLEDSTKRNKDVQLDGYLGDLIDLLLLNLFPRGTSLQIVRELEAIHVDYDKAMRIAIVLNELVCNAIEHGLPGIEQPVLRITVKRNGKQLAVSVHDNGPGITNNGKETKQGKGRDLVVKLLHKVHGTIVYRNDNGCVAEVTVPL